MAQLRFTRRGLLRLSMLGAATGAAGILISACGGGQAPAPTAAPAPAAPAAAAPTNTVAPAAPAAAAGAPTAMPAAAAAAPAAGTYPATLEIGINLPFTGADAADAANIRDGALMAIED